MGSATKIMPDNTKLRVNGTWWHSILPVGRCLGQLLSKVTFDNSSRRVVAECYQPGVSVSVVAPRYDRYRHGRRRFRRVSAYRMAAASGVFAETLGSCVRHLVTDHLKTGADRRWLISLFFPNHRTTIGANSVSSSAAGKNQTAFPRQTTTAWRHHYNTIRPHSSLGYRPPTPEAILPNVERPTYAVDGLRLAHQLNPRQTLT